MLEGTAEAGATTELLDIKQRSLLRYDPADNHPPDSVLRMWDRITPQTGSSGAVQCTQGTISGSFENALDWLKLLSDRPPYLTDKVVDLISRTGGMQGVEAVNTMEFVVRAPWLGSSPGNANCTGVEGV